MDFTQIDTSKSRFEKAKVQTFSEIGKLKDGVNTHRIITGPVTVETNWYPTIVEKEGKLIQSVRTIVRPPDGTVLDDIAKLDEQLTRKRMAEDNCSSDEIKKFRSALRPNRAYRFLVFDREADNQGAPTVRPFDYPFTVKDHLETLQNTKAQKHPGFLEFGLVFMYDVYISRVKDTTKKVLHYSIDYTVQVVTDTLPLVTKQQRIPTSWLDFVMGSGQSPWKWEDYFTEQELTAISEYDKDLDTLCKTDTPESAQEKLSKNPIFLDAKHLWGDRKGQPMFPVLNSPQGRELLLEGYKEMLMLEAPGEVQEVPKQEGKTAVNIPPAEQKASEIKPATATVFLKDRLTPKVTEVKPTVPNLTPAAVSTATKVPVAPVKKLWTR